MVIFHKRFFCFFQNILKCLQWLTDFVSIFHKICSIFNSFDNKDTNLLFVSAPKHKSRLLILFLNYFKIDKKCVENI